MWELKQVAVINSCHWSFTDSDALAVKVRQKRSLMNLLLLHRMLTSSLQGVYTITSEQFSR